MLRGRAGLRKKEREMYEGKGRGGVGGGRRGGGGGKGRIQLVIAAVLVLSCTLWIFSSRFRLSLTGGRGSVDEEVRKHVLVTGGAGFIGSHAALKLLELGMKDNLSRGNRGAISVLSRLAPPGRFTFLEGDLGVRRDVLQALTRAPVDLVIHFAAVAYVGESVADPVMYYKNITSNTIILLDAMKEAGTSTLVYSSTCATYGNPLELPITERTPPNPINPYGKAKLAAEEVIREYAKSDPHFEAAILRYFNVYGSDPEGRLGELPRPELRRLGRISGACFDAALGFIPELTVMGTTHPTRDGTAVRDYIHVTDLVDAHVRVADHLQNPPVLYNVGTGKGISVKEFVDACKKVTGGEINVKMQKEPRPGDYAEVFADPSKIREELNWTAQYTNLDEAMGHAWNWRKAHKTRY